jgi:hypothetical protein
MARIHRQRTATACPLEKRPGQRSNVVLDERIARPLMAGHVLHEAAAAHDIEHLEATADAQDRKVALDRVASDGELELIPLGVHVAASVVVFPIPAGIDVSAPRQQQAVHVRRHLVARVQRDHLGAGALERLAVVALLVGRGRLPSRERQGYAGLHAPHGIDALDCTIADDDRRSRAMTGRQTRQMGR